MKGRGSRRGFSLTEVVIAFGILAFCLSALAALIPAAMSVSRDAVNDFAIATVMDKATADITAKVQEIGVLQATNYVLKFDRDGRFATNSNDEFFTVDLELKQLPSSWYGERHIESQNLALIDLVVQGKGDVPPHRGFFLLRRP
jgi:uncharacterized protein (TIGR02598 family)